MKAFGRRGSNRNLITEINKVPVTLFGSKGRRSVKDVKNDRGNMRQVGRGMDQRCEEEEFTK